MQPRLGIYIHIPFCASKCGYCDFYSCAGAAERMAEYQQALLEHIEESAGRIAPAYIDTVYFGGGTPSFYGAARLIELLDAVKATGRLLKRAEVTVEVNPDSVRLHALRALRKDTASFASAAARTSCLVMGTWPRMKLSSGKPGARKCGTSKFSTRSTLSGAKLCPASSAAEP